MVRVGLAPNTLACILHDADQLPAGIVIAPGLYTHPLPVGVAGIEVMNGDPGMVFPCENISKTVPLLPDVAVVVDTTVPPVTLEQSLAVVSVASATLEP